MLICRLRHTLPLLMLSLPLFAAALRAIDAARATLRGACALMFYTRVRYAVTRLYDMSVMRRSVQRERDDAALFTRGAMALSTRSEPAATAGY